MSVSSRVVALAVVVVVAVPSCKKMAGSDASSPDEKYRESADDPLAELDHLEQQMLRLGLAVGPREAPAPAGDGAAVDMDSNSFAAGEAEAESKAEAVEEQEPRDEASPPPAAADESAEGRTRGSQCGNICDLSEAICELEGRICSLSESHGGDPTYANACQRAGDDCEVADHECDRCAD